MDIPNYTTSKYNVQKISVTDVDAVYSSMIGDPYYVRSTINPLLRKLKESDKPLSSAFYLSMFTYHAVVLSEKYYNNPSYGLHPQRLGQEVGRLLYSHFMDEIKEAKCQS